MRNIFALTKTEQRVVIFIVMALVALGAIRAYREKIINDVPFKSDGTGEKPAIRHPVEEPNRSGDAP